MRQFRKKMNTESNSDLATDATSSEEEDEEPKKKGRRTRGSNKDEDHVKGFTQSEVRKFVRSFRKFGDPLHRYT